MPRGKPTIPVKRKHSKTPKVKVKKTARKKTKRVPRPTIAIKGSENDSRVGHTERLHAFMATAVKLKRKDFFLHEIAQQIADEYDLESVPSIQTVATWLNKADEFIKDEIQDLQLRMRTEQYTQLERLKAKWLAISLADDIQIQRWRMEEGILMPFFDENVMSEQLEATKTVVKIMDRQAKLLGIDIQKAVSPTGEGPQSLQDLQIWITNSIAFGNDAPHGKSIDVQGEVLELRSGIPELDNDEI